MQEKPTSLATPGPILETSIYGVNKDIGDSGPGTPSGPFLAVKWA